MPEFLIGELVRQRMGTLSASERRLAQVLLAFYPVAGLESLTRFAERAGVSPATATRFITKLGLRGYPEFQDSLREELQARLSSPLARLDLAEPAHSDSVLHDSFATFEHSLRTSLDMVSEHDFEAVVDLLSSSRGRVLALGGRVSAFLARYLASQLHLIRGGVELIDPERSNPADHLVDLGRRDVLVVFDYRRYQSDTISSAEGRRQPGQHRRAAHRPVALTGRRVVEIRARDRGADDRRSLRLNGLGGRPHRGTHRRCAVAPRGERACTDAPPR